MSLSAYKSNVNLTLREGTRWRNMRFLLEKPGYSALVTMPREPWYLNGNHGSFGGSTAAASGTSGATVQAGGERSRRHGFERLVSCSRVPPRGRLGTILAA
ncbi:hypothetical protein GCM10010524_11060 [Streptomyces mexicanus]